MPDLKIAPSILSADFGKLNEEIASVEPYSDLIHVDVMDGHFVNNISLGPPVVAGIKTQLPLDCHLMIEHPAKYIEAFKKVGAGIIHIHREVFDRQDQAVKVINQIKDLGMKAGIALNPDTGLEKISDLIPLVDVVLMMTVWPGFSGQKFIAEVLPKVQALRMMAPDLDIEVDGGVTDETGRLSKEAGANILVAASYIFGAGDRVEAIGKLKS